MPLKIETGRFSGINIENRLCQVCNGNAMEDDVQILFHCSVYNDLRIQVINKIQTKEHGFNATPDIAKLNFVFRYEDRIC